RTPLKRLTTPEDVANVALFLCSELSAMIHGQVVTVDGGYAIQG
ncbi:MAG: 3-oxoacyl-ACP reductase, partial [Desulfobulbaceae bacterium A2]